MIIQTVLWTTMRQKIMIPVMKAQGVTILKDPVLSEMALGNSRPNRELALMMGTR